MIGVIGPWNYPVFTPMGSIAYALAAGNAVVFKPSEYTPGVGKWLADTLRRGRPRRTRVFQLVTGLGETGAALCRAGVDKIAFTGSAATGRKVMAACAENLMPVLMECGGKDAMIVDDDADVEAAADAAVWGGMSNAGQTCIGTERVYATRSVYDAFVDVVDRARRGDVVGRRRPTAPMTMPSQSTSSAATSTTRSTRGGRAIVGGGSSIRPRSSSPSCWSTCPRTRGDHARRRSVRRSPSPGSRTSTRPCARANATGYGLASAVFSAARGMEIARRLRPA